MSGFELNQIVKARVKMRTNERILTVRARIMEFVPPKYAKIRFRRPWLPANVSNLVVEAVDVSQLIAFKPRKKKESI